MGGMSNTFFPILTPSVSSPVRRHWLLAACGLTLLLSMSPIAGAQPAASAASAVTVPTAVLALSGNAAEFSLTGAIQAVRQVTLAAQTSGNVTQLAVKAGDRVKAGQLIARVDDRASGAGVRASVAGVEQAQAQWLNSKQQLERTRDLRQQGFISQAAVDSADAQYRAAQAGLDQARASQSQASLSNTFAKVTAPFDGIVLSTHVETGELAAPGRPLVTLYAPGRMRAVVDVPASQSTSARAATQTEVGLPDGRWLTPSLRQELPSADPVSQTVEWRLELPATTSANVNPGQSVQVRFSGAPAPSGNATRPRVPSAAVLQRGELSAMYAVQDGRFVLRPVRLGPDQGKGTVEVLAGLKPGDRYALDAVRAGLAGAVPAR